MWFDLGVRRWLPGLPALLVAGLILFALYRLFGAAADPARQPGRIWGTGYPQSHAQAVTHLAEEAAVDERRGLEGRDDWLSFANAAAGRIEVGRLSGNPEAWDAAKTDLDRAFQIAPEGSGPHQILATWAMGVHRLGDAETALNAIYRYAMADPIEAQGEQRAMRGDIALYRGNYPLALGEYRLADSYAGPLIRCRTANLLAWLGSIGKALDALAQCEAGPKMRTPQFAAGVELQRGAMLLQRGRLDEAEAAFSRADRIFPGYWRIEMRRAQIAALKGDVAGALDAFEAIANRTGSPEPMDVAAGLYRSQGNAPAARQWAARAKRGWARRLALTPEAAWAHAAEHELAFGDPKRALLHAGRNARNRPYAESLIILAKAWIANGRPDYAAALAGKVDRSGWRSAEQYAVEAEALALLGKGDDAQQARDKAAELNPLAATRNAAFVWLDH